MDQKGGWLISGKPWLLLMGDMGSWGVTLWELSKLMIFIKILIRNRSFRDSCFLKFSMINLNLKYNNDDKKKVNTQLEINRIGNNKCWIKKNDFSKEGWLIMSQPNGLLILGDHLFFKLHFLGGQRGLINTAGIINPMLALFYLYIDIHIYIYTYVYTYISYIIMFIRTWYKVYVYIYI